MYYHSRPLKYVVYDKVGPPPVEAIDDFFVRAYKWLGKHCGYFPQIWLSRSKSQITGYKFEKDKDSILFGFENIKGFPLDYQLWCALLNPLINNQTISHYMQDCMFYAGAHPDEEDPLLTEQLNCYKDFGEDAFLKKYLFVERDQVVVPTLNLKAAKEIYCHNEKQIKKLRQMGFIKDRIKILKVK